MNNPSIFNAVLQGVGTACQNFRAVLTPLAWFNTLGDRAELVATAVDNIVPTQVISPDDARLMSLAAMGNGLNRSLIDVAPDYPAIAADIVAIWNALKAHQTPVPFPSPPVCGPILNGAFEEILPVGAMFPTECIWWTSIAKLIRLVDTTYVRQANHLPSSIVTRVYVEGIVVQTITDTITYSGLVVATVTRSVV